MSNRAPHRPETIERLRASALLHWSNPDARSLQSEITKRRMARPGVREKLSEHAQARFSDPANRAEHAATIAKAMQAPAVRQRIRDGIARAAQKLARVECVVLGDE